VELWMSEEPMIEKQHLVVEMEVVEVEEVTE
jgi:hypothetical protein